MAPTSLHFSSDAPPQFRRYLSPASDGEERDRTHQLQWCSCTCIELRRFPLLTVNSVFFELASKNVFAHCRLRNEPERLVLKLPFAL